MAPATFLYSTLLLAFSARIHFVRAINHLQSYDFIVVGSGASGAVLAHHLSQKGQTLLIEKGANYSAYPQERVQEGWPQIAALTSKNHWTDSIPTGFSVGNVFGGGTTLNAGVCWRGAASVFEAAGIHRDDAARAFRWIEEHVCSPVQNSTFSQLFVDSWKELGLELGHEAGQASWAASPLSVQHARSLFSRSGLRNNVARALIDGAEDKSNLTVLLHTTVLRILFNSDAASGKRAIGVKVSNAAFGELSLMVQKGGEIFLSAGALESPKILLLSGIGPQVDLQSVGIEVIHHSPKVGHNLIDRKEFMIGTPIIGEMGNDEGGIFDVTMFTPDVWISKVPKDDFPWGNAFTLSSFLPGDRHYKCFQQLVGGLLLKKKGTFPEPLGSMATMNLAQRHPRARGYIKLVSREPDMDPEIHDGWDSPDGEYDLEVLVNNTVQYLFPIFQNTDFLKRIGHPPRNSSIVRDVTTHSLERARLGLQSLDSFAQECPSRNPKLQQGCGSLSECVPTVPALPRSYERLRAAIREIVSASSHPMGTTAAGQVVEPGTFKVKGVEGLRVVDLSVVPIPVDIHPMMTAMALGRIIGLKVQPLPAARGEQAPVISGIILATLTGIFTALVMWRVGIMMIKSAGGQADLEPSFAIPHANSRAERFCSHGSHKNSHQQHDDAGEGENYDVVGVEISAHTNHITGCCKTEKEAQVCSSTLAPALAWKDISVTCHRYTPFSTTSSIVLQGVTGEVFAGEILAIMGASGSGKTTLLDTLAGCKSFRTLSGLVACEEQITNVSSAASQLRRCCAYIPREPPLMPMQTAEEAVVFSASVTCHAPPAGSSHKERAEHILDAVGLLDAAHRLIGGTLPGGAVVRGLSGGKRKRLALACALATQPRVLLLDEVTSESCSADALAIMQLIQKLSKLFGVAMIVVVHQPSPQIIQLSDSLLLLSAGKVIFSGHPCELPDYHLEHIGSQNAAGDIERALCGIQEEAQKPLALASSSGTPSIFEQSFSSGFCATRKPSSMWQLREVFLRSLLSNYIRNPVNLLTRLLCYIILTVINGAVFWDAGSTEQAADMPANVIGAFTFISMISYLLPVAMLPVFCWDKDFFRRERSLHLYAPWIFCVSQACLEIWVLSLAALAQACIVVSMCGLGKLGGSYSAVEAFWAFVSILAMGGCVGSSIVRLVGIALPPQDVAFNFGSGIITVGLVGIGGLVASSMFPGHLSSLGWASPCKYTLQALSTTQFLGSRYEAALEVLGLNNPHSITTNLLVLACIFATVNMASILCLSLARNKS